MFVVVTVAGFHARIKEKIKKGKEKRRKEN